jgi:uncharacterized protein Yka (UPF0111/DUF47 family)
MKKPPYEKESLKRNIEKCYETIKSFQEAIEKEYQRISDLKKYIKDIEEYEKYINNNTN